MFCLNGKMISAYYFGPVSRFILCFFTNAGFTQPLSCITFSSIGFSSFLYFTFPFSHQTSFLVAPLNVIISNLYWLKLYLTRTNVASLSTIVGALGLKAEFSGSFAGSSSRLKGFQYTPGAKAPILDGVFVLSFLFLTDSFFFSTNTSLSSAFFNLCFNSSFFANIVCPLNHNSSFNCSLVIPFNVTLSMDKYYGVISCNPKSSFAPSESLTLPPYLLLSFVTRIAPSLISGAFSGNVLKPRHSGNTFSLKNALPPPRPSWQKVLRFHYCHTLQKNSLQMI
mmetsp:Transcript_64674/g.75893  ORF Transcript_64674/g.75893 Transcript_64674/m.75893 type:complete len:281 (-) Transcript_64674:313-1155(-)